MQTLFNKLTSWQRETFGQATVKSKICHLREEVEELLEAVERDSPNRRLEYADCFLLLFGAAEADGMMLDDIESAIWEKLHINQKRKWGNPDKNGVVNHINEAYEDYVRDDDIFMSK